MLETSKDGAPLGEPIKVTVSLGNATNVTSAAAGVSTLGTVEVIGSRVINAVDVTSTESSMNITAAEVDKLPVPRDVREVALLAPCCQCGSFGGISFGGSSVANKHGHINGLNVTDLYRRIDFSRCRSRSSGIPGQEPAAIRSSFGRTTGGVINAVTKSGTNEFQFGTERIWEPEFCKPAAAIGATTPGGRFSADATTTTIAPI